MAILLINCGAECDVQASDGKTHLIDEAVFSGDRRLVRLIYSKLQDHLWTQVKGPPIAVSLLAMLIRVYNVTMISQSGKC